jgi:basic membrane protein A and related proteins
MKQSTSFLMRRKRRSWLAFTLALIAILPAVLVSGCDPGKNGPSFGFEKNSNKLQVGFITVGPASDWGYNYQHNQGRLGMEALLRDKVHTVLAENIPETADVERVMQRMVDEGANLIFSTSYGYADSSLRVAQKNPNVTFMQALGTKNAANLGDYSLKVWEPAYVAGVVAAMTAKNETHLGFLGAYPIPPIYWTVNAFTLGAQSVNKDITVDIVFTNSWNNPTAETEAVKSLVGRNVKVVYVLVDSPIAGVQAAERAGIYSLAHFADLSGFAPKGWLTGAQWKWSKLYEDVTLQVINKKWTNQPVAGGFKEGYVGLAPFGPAVDGATQQKARELSAKIASGELNVFAGPLYDNQGKERIPAGKSLSVDEILTLDWAVRGVGGAQK